MTVTVTVTVSYDGMASCLGVALLCMALLALMQFKAVLNNREPKHSAPKHTTTIVRHDVYTMISLSGVCRDVFLWSSGVYVS